MWYSKSLKPKSTSKFFGKITVPRVIEKIQKTFDEISQLCKFLKEKINSDRKKVILFAAYRIFSLKGASKEDREKFNKKIQADLKITMLIDGNSWEFQQALKIFGLTDKITSEDLDKVYKLKLEKTNPEKLKDMDPEIQQFAQRKFNEIQEAYIKLIKKIKA